MLTKQPLPQKQLLAVLLVASAALATSATTQASMRPLVEIQTVLVGDPGNADESNWGGVAYSFRIGRFEVTAEEYCAFLNAVAKSDPYGLFDANMQTAAPVASITRSGSSGSYSYNVIAGRERIPITYISWFDAARFANWMHNGATASASTETGAYELNGAISGTSFSASPSAKWRLPSGDEFFKAGYYKGGGTNAGYWRFATQNDEVPGNQVGHYPNQANFGTSIEPAWQGGALTRVASYTASPSYYGTFDQSGSLFEWIDDVQPNNSSKRYLVGGSQGYNPEYMQFGYMYFWDNASIPSASREITGFRLVKTDIADNPQMVYVSGGTLPSSSQLAGQQVGAFLIRKTETTLDEWIDTKIWAKANGYSFQWPNDQLDISEEWFRLYRFTAVGSVSYYDIAAWCNAKSEREGLQPVYMLGGSVYRGGVSAPTVNSSANGYRMPSEAEWEWAARGGVKSQGFIYSGSNDLEEVGWGAVSAPGTGSFPIPVALKKHNELGLLDMTGNSFEVCNDTNGSGRRIARGGAVYNRTSSVKLADSVFRVDNRSASTTSNDRDLWDLGGIWGQTFRLVKTVTPGGDSDGDGVTDYREDKDGTDPADPSSFNPLSKSLVAYYPFEGSASDESGFGNNGVVTGATPAADRGGSTSKAYAFNGSSYIQIPNSDSLSFGFSDLTVSAWIRTTDSGGRYIYSDDADLLRPGLELSHLGAATYFEFSDGSRQWPGTSAGANPVNDGKWHHIVLTFGRSGAGRIYVDGKLDLEKAPVSAQLQSISNTHPSRIGANLSSDWGFIGEIDDVRLYRRALSAAEVLQLYAVESGGIDADNDGCTNYREGKDGTDPFDPASFNPLSKDLLAYYVFDADLADDSGYGRDLNQISNVQRISDIRSSQGQSLQLPSSSGSDARSSATSGLSGNMPRSVSFWFYSDGPQPWPSGNIVMVAGDATSTGPTSRVAIDRGEGTIQIDNGSGREARTVPVPDLHQRVHHFVWTYQDNLTNSKFYLNGKPLAAGAIDNATLDGLGTYPVRIGDLNDRGFVGKLDDLRVYKRVLTPTEVQQIYALEAQKLDTDQDGLIDVVEFRLEDMGFDRYAAQPATKVQSIFSNPNLAGLYTDEQYTGAFEGGRNQGRDDVVSQPGLYGLFNEDSLADINLGGVVVRKLGNAVNLEVQVQMSPDINAQPFTNLPYRHLLYIDGLPSNKAFLRIRALGPQ